jgi:hypothetical protein
MKKIIFALALTFLATGAYAGQDVASVSKAPNLTDGSFPILFTIPLAMNDYCVGVGYDGANFWVSAGDQATGICEFYIFDEYGNQLDNVPQGGGATSWGHRDMAWNGTYMFGSYSTLIDAFGGDYAYAGYFVGPLNPNRALAYDGTYFYTCGFGQQLCKLVWDGVFGSVAAVTYLGVWDAAYGLAYDEVSDVLWMSTADYTGNIWQMTTDGFLINSYTSMPEYDIAGGCTMACTAQFGYVLVILMQSAPDTLVFYDLGYGPTAADAGSWGAIKAMFR